MCVHIILYEPYKSVCYFCFSFCRFAGNCLTSKFGHSTLRTCKYILYGLLWISVSIYVSRFGNPKIRTLGVANNNILLLLDEPLLHVIESIDLHTDVNYEFKTPAYRNIIWYLICRSDDLINCFSNWNLAEYRYSYVLL